MDFEIRNRVALVTGASSGLGEAVALALAREGVTLAVAARRRDKLEAVAANARTQGAARAHVFEVDLSDASSITAMLRDVRAACGEIDILVLNGGGPKPGTYLETKPEDFERAYRNTLRSALDLVDAIVPGMRSRGWGRIVALTSTSVKQPIKTLALSNIFRTALVSALKTLSIEVARDGVTVNAIATGRVLTDRLRELYPDEASLHRAAQAEIPIGRVATPGEFASMAAFLCSDPARYITGQTIAVDGGLIASLF